MRALTTNCDSCGEHLKGKKGTAWIERAFITVKGLMSVSFKDETNNQFDYYYITHNPEDEHNFCDWECLQNFAAVREKQYARARQNRLKAEANQEI